MCSIEFVAFRTCMLEHKEQESVHNDCKYGIIAFWAITFPLLLKWNEASLVVESCLVCGSVVATSGFDLFLKYTQNVV